MNTKIQTLILTVSVAILSGALLLSFSLANPVTAQRIIEWKTYTDQKLGVSAEYPSTWEVKPKLNRFESGPDVTITGEGFDLRLAKLQTEGASDFSLKTLANGAQNRLVTQNPSASLIEDIDTSRYTIDGEQAATFLYTFEQQGIKAAQQIVITKHEGVVYLFSMIGDPDLFDQKKEIMDHFFNSIKFLGGTSSSSNSSNDDSNNGQAGQGPSVLPS
jgi:hypothetical protein